MIISFKKLMPKKLFARGIVIIAVPILLLQITVVYLIFERYWERVTERLSETSVKELALLLATPPEQRKVVAQYLELNFTFHPNEGLPPKNKILQFDFLHETLDRRLRENINNDFWIDTQSFWRRVNIKIKTQNGVLNTLIPLNRVYAEKTYQIIIWIAAIGLIVLLIAILFLRSQVRPIQHLAIAAQRFGRGLDVQYFSPTGAKEVREAGLAFLVMRDNLQAHITQRTNMLSAISHDMRTALTRLKLQTALLKNHDEREILESDLENMEKMLLEYLDFAQGEGKKEKPQLVNYTAMIKTLIEPHKQITFNCPNQLSLLGRPQAMRRAFANLIHNAVTYGNKVEINANFLPSSGIEITIDDDGPGIDAKDYEAAFRPFSRLDESRNQNIVGTGLGLAIVHDIIQSIGGSITLNQSPQKGLRVKVFLPA